MKTILLHVQDDPSLDARLQAALALARSFSAHLRCLHVTPIETYAATGTFDGAILVEELAEALEKSETAVRERIEGQLASEDVSWDYEQVTGPTVNMIIRDAALADLVVTGRERHSSKAPWASQISLIGDLLHRCRTPLYLPPSDTAPADPMAPVVIAWHGSYEAANAVRAALSLLRAAERVIVLRVEREAKDDFPDTRLLEYLSGHGIQAELKTEAPMREDVAGIIVGEAMQLSAGTIVMGGYNHSRIGELVFGGVTRTLLLDCPVPLLMAH